jgi:hypothetical protein
MVARNYDIHESDSLKARKMRNPTVPCTLNSNRFFLLSVNAQTGEMI